MQISLFVYETKSDYLLTRWVGPSGNAQRLLPEPSMGVATSVTTPIGVVKHTMPTMPPSFQSRGQGSARDRSRAYERDRGSAADRGYDSKWRKARTAFLAEHPLCVMCEADGRVAAATVVDHITPHRGDHGLFWSRSNWQALCKPHHDRDKQRVDRARRD